MLERNTKGFIIGDYKVPTHVVDGYKYLIAIEGCPLTEFSKEGYNRILWYFQEKLGLKVFVDNLNHDEWKDAAKAKTIAEITNRANIAYGDENAAFAKDFIERFSKEFGESSSEVFNRDLKNTLLAIYIDMNGDKVILELPYCTAEKICDAVGEISID